MNGTTIQSGLERIAQRSRLLISALAIGVIMSLATSASALTIIDFDLINPTSTSSTGSNTKTVAVGGPYWGTADGTMQLTFQGDGTSIENGAVSLTGGVLSTYGVTAVPPIITVTTDLASTFANGANDAIGDLTLWDGTSGVIEFHTRVDVLNNGSLACVGTLCGALGTPPTGTQFDYVDEPVTHARAWADMAISFDLANPTNPFHFQLAESLTGRDAATNDPVLFMSLEGEGAIVPEPTTGLLVAMGLVGLAAKRKTN